MYRIKPLPWAGYGVIAHISGFFQSWQLNGCDSGIPRIQSDQCAIECVSTKIEEHPRSVAILAYLLTSVLLCSTLGCGGVVFSAKGKPTPSGTAQLAATPSSVDFGTVTVGASANQKINIANTGSEPVQITSLTPSDAAFTISGQGTLPVSLAAGSSLTFSVQFIPKNTVDSTSQLSISAMSSTSK